MPPYKATPHLSKRLLDLFQALLGLRCARLGVPRRRARRGRLLAQCLSSAFCIPCVALAGAGTLQGSRELSFKVCQLLCKAGRGRYGEGLPCWDR
jgi:hypothetical protein